MRTESNQGTSQFRCNACGRKFDTPEQWKEHQPECEAAKATGSGNTQTSERTLEEGDDRDWVSTP
jgi:hypothetical protein